MTAFDGAMCADVSGNTCIFTHTSSSVCVCMCVGGQALTGAALNTDNLADVLQLRWCQQKLPSSLWLLEGA